LPKALVIFTAFFFFAYMPGLTLAQGDGPHARPKLVTERATAMPGQTLWVAIDFDIDPHWHTYWPGDNDTGFSLVTEIECSPQAEPGELVWPAPKRYSDIDGILDHVFEERMTVLLPLAVHADAKLGDEIVLTIGMRWLICKTVCLAESTDLSIRITISDALGRVSPETASTFAEARRRVPKPVTSADPVTAVFEDRILTISSKNAERLAFYSKEDGRRTRNLLGDGEAEGAMLSIEFRESDDPILGVLEVWSSPVNSRLYDIEWPPIEPAAAPSGTQKH
jgi:DsbC/DsbD-like thiol-disulfide interchange protein